MALLHLSSSPSPRKHRTFSGDCSKYIHGQVPSTPLKPPSCLQKSKRNGAFADKDARFDVETIAACNHGYGERLLSNRGCLMETLTMEGANLQGFGKIHKRSANPNVVPAKPYEANADSSLFNANPNVLNPNPNLLSNNPSGFSDCSHLSFNEGDDSGKGSGSGRRGGGSGGHNFGPDNHFNRHNSGLAILGMHTFFQGIEDGKFTDHKAAFDSVNSFLRTLVSASVLAGGRVNRSIDNKEALSEFPNVFEPEIDALDQNEVDDLDIVRIGRDASAVDNDYARRQWDITGLSAHHAHASSSLLNNGFNEKASEKTRDASYICSTCSSQTNSLPSEITVETYKRCQRLCNFLAHVYRNASHFGQKFSEENYNVPVNVSTEVDVMHGGMPCSEQDDEIHMKACNMEGTMDSMVLLTGSEQDMELLSSSFSSSSVRVQSAAHHEPQGVIGWLGQLARPALAMQVGNHEDTSPAKQVTQHESRVSSTEGVPASPKVDSQTSESPTVAKQSDVDTLKRLQREAFFELMKLRDKLEKLEQLAQARQKLDKVGAARMHLQGQVKVGTAFVLLEDSSSRHARDSLEQAGMQTGLDVKFTFETPFREKDVLITQCISGQDSNVGDGRALGGPLSVGKLQYVAHVNDDVSFSFVPLGAQGKDVTEIINVLQDQGLTTFSSQGPALFNHCKGSALGSTVSGSRFAFSLAQYLSGWGNRVSATGSLSEEDPLCLSTLGQFLLQPTEGFILSLSGLNRYWPSPPPPSSLALHWSEMGPLVIPKIQSFKENQLHKSQFGSKGEFSSHTNRTGSHWENRDLEYGVSSFESQGASLLSLAVASSLDLSDNVSVSCWAQIEKGEMFQDPDRGNVQWAMSLAKNSGTGIDWGASIGASQQDIWSMTTNNDNDFPGHDGNHFRGPQLHVEAFLKLSCGRGCTLQPGLLYVSNKHSHTPAFVVRSSWSL